MKGNVPPEGARRVRKLSYQLEKRFKLYKFQKEAYNNWLDAEEFGTIVIPTGGGKTYVAMRSIIDKPVNTLICVITEQLMNQWACMLKKLCGVSQKNNPPSQKQTTRRTQNCEETPRRKELHIH